MSRQNFLTRACSYQVSLEMSSNSTPLSIISPFYMGSVFLTDLSPVKGTMGNHSNIQGLFAYRGLCRCHLPSFSNSWLLRHFIFLSNSSRGYARSRGGKIQATFSSLLAGMEEACGGGRGCRKDRNCPK